MDDASRIFWLKRSFDRTSTSDTMVAPSLARVAMGHSPGELFFEFYDAVRDWLAGRKERGLGVIALTEEGIQAKAFLKAFDDRVNTAVVGRHECAEILLGDDPSLSLRHLAVLVSPSADSQPLRYRVVDLRTTAGFTDERGTRVRACEADEPFLIRCGSYSLLFAPAGRGTFWPDEPEDVWASLRERNATTTALPHPYTLEHSLLSEDEEALGELSIRSEQGYGKMSVGRRAARAGILLGRSDRCDGDALLGNPHISRVHVLIVEMAGRLYAIDTASKNGVWGHGGEERSQILESGTAISLCGLATVDWRFFH